MSAATNAQHTKRHCKKRQFQRRSVCVVMLNNRKKPTSATTLNEAGAVVEWCLAVQQRSPVQPRSANEGRQKQRRSGSSGGSNVPRRACMSCSEGPCNPKKKISLNGTVSKVPHKRSCPAPAYRHVQQTQRRRDCQTVAKSQQDAHVDEQRTRRVRTHNGRHKRNVFYQVPIISQRPSWLCPQDSIRNVREERRRRGGQWQHRARKRKRRATAPSRGARQNLMA